MQNKLAEKEKRESDAHSLSSASARDRVTPDLTEVILKQTEVMDKMNQTMKAAKEPKVGSTIKVEPRVKWPELHDSHNGGRDVIKFFEDFEKLVNLMNNAKGMTAVEKVVTLQICLHGSRKKIFDNIDDKYGKNLECDQEVAKKIYKEVKERLLQFSETPTEQQLSLIHI